MDIYVCAVNKFLKNQSTHQTIEGRLLNQNHNKRKHRELMWKPEVGKTMKRKKNFTITIVIIGEPLLYAGVSRFRS